MIIISDMVHTLDLNNDYIDCWENKHPFEQAGIFQGTANEHDKPEPVSITSTSFAKTYFMLQSLLVIVIFQETTVVHMKQ